MTTIAECLRLSRDLQVIAETARLDCEVLLSHVLDKDRAYLYTWPEKCLTEAQYTTFMDAINLRKQGMPVAHIIGQKEFWSLPLSVNQTTLIPRPETELLVEVALNQLPEPIMPKTVADLGTGTGAIAFAIATERPHWRVWAYDKYLEVVNLAKVNLQALGLLNVSLVCSDWFQGVGDQKFDLIVSNPPYISSEDEHLKQGDVRFEPKTALVAEKNGLADIQHIIQQSPNYLNEGGWLLLEHGFQQAEYVQDMLHQSGFESVFTEKDLSGQPRVTGGQWAS